MVNWRDPFSDVVHIVAYGNIENENMWTKHSYQRETERAMVCGLSVSVTRDGLIKREEALVLLPWVHTREHPTCLACVSGIRTAETLRWDPDGPADTDELDDEENDVPLDEGSEA